MRADSFALAAATVAALLLFAGAWILVRKSGALWALLQLLGALCLIVVVLVHFCEANNLFPEMGWGQTDSIGHYIDVASLPLSLVLFPLGYLLYALRVSRS